MPFRDWQRRWQFDFQQEFKAGMMADDAAMKAKRFWWREQNRSFKQDCRRTPNCGFPTPIKGSASLSESESEKW
jgi:hypothetical protein